MTRKSLFSLFLLATTAQADLIDLTPGGWTGNNPPELFQVFRQTFFDEAEHGWNNTDGWVSRYGTVNGGQFFFTDLFAHPDGQYASVYWDMTTAPAGYWMGMVLLAGDMADGTIWQNVYRVPLSLRYVDLHEIVTIHEGVTIRSIAFYGINDLPDTGTTLLLMGIGLGTVAIVRRKYAEGN